MASGRRGQVKLVPESPGSESDDGGCVICHSKAEKLVGTVEGLNKLRQAAGYLDDGSTFADGAKYHLKPCHSNYMKRGNRAREKKEQEDLVGNARVEEDQEEIYVINVDESLTSPTSSAQRASGRSRNVSNPQSVAKEERPCMICQKTSKISI